jgi:hypothetical protein
MSDFYQIPVHDSWILQGDIFRGIPVDSVVFEEGPVVKSLTDIHRKRAQATRVSRLLVIASNSCDVSEEDGRVVQEIVVAQLRPIDPKFQSELKAIGGPEALNTSHPAEYVRFFYYPQLAGSHDQGLLADFSQLRTISRADLSSAKKVGELHPDTQQLFRRRLALHFARPYQTKRGGTTATAVAPAPRT